MARVGITVLERLKGLDTWIEAAILEQQVFGDGGGWGPQAEYLGGLMRERSELLALAVPPT